MISKKLLRVIPVAILLAIAAPAYSAYLLPAAIDPVHAPATEDPAARQMLERLREIRQMDKTELTRSEKKELRKEVKDIKKEMEAIKGGVYLSVGAIIIVILLLILLL